MTRGRAVVAKPHARRNTREGCSTAEGVPGRESCASSRTGGRSGLGSVHEGPLPTRSGAPALPCGSRNLEWIERQGHPEVDSRLEGRRECLLRCAAVHSGGFRCRETPGSPGTARVVKATRGRSREIDETRVLVAVLGSRDWQAASPYVIQGKSQGDLGMRGLARYQPSGAVDAASLGVTGPGERVRGARRGICNGSRTRFEIRDEGLWLACTIPDVSGFSTAQPFTGLVGRGPRPAGRGTVAARSSRS